MYKKILLRDLLLGVFVLLCCWGAGVSLAEAQKDAGGKTTAQSPFLAVDPPLRVALLLPGKTRFWKMFADYAQAAAEDLNMRLQVVITGNNPGLFLRRLEDVCHTGVDGVIMYPPSARGEDALRVTERNGVPCFLVNARSSGIHFYPRSKYDTWLGSMSASNEMAGALLLQTLVDAAYGAGIASMNILAIGGNPEDPSSGERLKGFENALMQQPSIRKFETAHIGTDPQQAASVFWEHYQKDPEINLVWCSTDAMALAVSERAALMAAGAEIMIGGIDWGRGALRAVLEGKLQASVGGQVFEGAWAVILLNDYLKGQDFAGEGVSYSAPLFAADKANSKMFSYLQGISPDAIDFRRFSKVCSPDRQSYGFDLLELATPPQSADTPQ